MTVSSVDFPESNKNLLITTEKGLLELAGSLEDATRVALDLETTGLDPRRHEVRLLTLATERGVWLVDCFEVDPRPLFPILAEKELVIHNASFDLGFLSPMGIEVAEGGNVTDTMLLSQLLCGQRPKGNSLEGVVRRELGVPLDKEHQSAEWGVELSASMLEYAATDARVLLPLARRLQEKVREAGLERVAEIEHRALLAVTGMQEAGIPFDVGGWEEYLKRVKETVDRLKEKLDELAPVHPDGGTWNWNSSPQITKAFALEGIELPNAKRETLSRHDHPLVKPLLEYKKAHKMLSSFGPKLLGFVRDDGRIHPSWRQIGAETGRMSCAGPNAQQLPPEVRHYVRAPEGRVLVWADYRQAEIRILACASGDPTHITAFRLGKDPYVATAAAMFGVPEDKVTRWQRNAAKIVNFSFIYGASPYGIAKRLGKPVYQAERLMARYFDAHPDVYEFLGATVQEVLDTGEVRTLSGRLRRLGDVHSMRYKDARATVREAMNHPMQGGCADGLKLALARLHERRHECPGAVIIVALHDEIVAECDEGEVDAAAAWLEKAMVEGMAEVLALGTKGDDSVPVEVEVKTGNTWGSGEPWPPPAREPGEEEGSDVFPRLDDVPARIGSYIDYRDPSVHNYAQIDVCDECAEGLNADLDLQGHLLPGEAAWCEDCGVGNAAAWSIANGGVA